MLMALNCPSFRSAVDDVRCTNANRTVPPTHILNERGLSGTPEGCLANLWFSTHPHAHL
jgi:hypothetical protein